MANIFGWTLSQRPASANESDVYTDLEKGSRYVFAENAWHLLPWAGTDLSDYVKKSALNAYAKKTDLTALEEAVRVTVAFDTDGGSAAPATQTITYNTVATQPANPTKADHNFLGWFLPDATEAFVFTTKVKNHITLTAHWEAAE